MYRPPLRQWALLKKKMNYCPCCQSTVNHIFSSFGTVSRDLFFSNCVACSRCPLHICRVLMMDSYFECTFHNSTFFSRYKFNVELFEVMQKHANHYYITYYSSI